MLYYQDNNLYYFRKPTGIPSTFGKEPSFLDILLQNPSPIAQSLFAFFWKEKELWLLNRLDNETSGLLYFAKNPRVYKAFKEMQSAFLLNKYYLAEVYGDIRTFCWYHPHPSLVAYPPDKAKYNEIPQYCGAEGSLWKITYPVAHHKFNSDRMVVIKNPSDLEKAKWTPHHLTTEIIEFAFLPTTKTSVLLIRIQKGFRHQIRAHLASIGFPICGDRLYSKSKHKDYDILQLFSVGLESVI